FQAEDGIRDFHVTGVQTCALPISSAWKFSSVKVSTSDIFFSCRFAVSEIWMQKRAPGFKSPAGAVAAWYIPFASAARLFYKEVEIGRASCRERVKTAARVV